MFVTTLTQRDCNLPRLSTAIIKLFRISCEFLIPLVIWRIENSAVIGL